MWDIEITIKSLFGSTSFVFCQWFLNWNVFMITFTFYRVFCIIWFLFIFFILIGIESTFRACLTNVWFLYFYLFISFYFLICLNFTLYNTSIILKYFNFFLFMLYLLLYWRFNFFRRSSLHSLFFKLFL